jgi:hypothetical protein
MLNFSLSELPGTELMKEETEHLLLSFCTFCTLLKGKKLNFQNIFILIIHDEKIRNILKDILSIDSNYELVKLFIDYDPLLATSKFVTRYLNVNPTVRL